MDCNLPGSFVHGDSSGKNTGVGSHALLQGIFPTQRSNWVLYTSTIWEAHLSPYEILYGRPFLSTDLLVNPETHYLAQYLLVLGLTLKNVWE